MISRASTTRLRQQLLHPGRRPGLAQLQELLQDRYDIQNDAVMPLMKELRRKRDAKLKERLLIRPKRRLKSMHYWLLVMLYFGSIEDFS